MKIGISMPLHLNMQYQNIVQINNAVRPAVRKFLALGKPPSGYYQYVLEVTFNQDSLLGVKKKNVCMVSVWSVYSTGINVSTYHCYFIDFTPSFLPFLSLLLHSIIIPRSSSEERRVKTYSLFLFVLFFSYWHLHYFRFSNLF